MVLLSHNHYDHCDLRTLGMLAARFDPIVVTPVGNRALVESAGIRRIEELDWWQPGTATAMPDHLDPGAPFLGADAVRSRPGAVGRVRARRPGAPGSTSPETRRMRRSFPRCRRRLGPIDLALLPIGAYEPRWFMRAVHMNPDEAVQAHLELGAPESIGMHFGTFQLTTEGIDEPLRALEAACRARGVAASRFRTLGFGDSARVGRFEPLLASSRGSRPHSMSETEKNYGFLLTSLPPYLLTAC